MSIDFVICEGVLKKYKGKGGDVVVPGSVTSIGERAFEWCTSLTSVSIPGSVTSIGEGAFYHCHSLTSITIPDSVTSIGKEAFESCNSLTSITIPDSVTSIGKEAFYYCNQLTSITIPDSVTSIGEGAFRECSSLTSVSIPDSVTSIGGAAFVGCYGLADASGLIILRDVIYGCKSDVTSITIPNSVKSIGESAFAECVTIPNSVTSCHILTSVSIPDSVTSIGRGAFRNCHSLTSITIPDSVTSIGAWAFYECSSLTSVSIPNGVKIIRESAFRGCSNLTSVSIPDSVTNIGESAFEGCSSLTSVSIPDSVTYIGESAFEGCSSLTSITIPDSVTYIEKSAFIGCGKLTAIKAPTRNLLKRCLKDLKKLKVLFTNESEKPITDDSQLTNALTQLADLRKNKNNCIDAAILAGQILYSDLPAAMRFAEKEGVLDMYAQMHGLTADELRESDMSDLGLDEHGECRWNLDGRDIVAALDADLVLTLTDTRTGKIVTTIPKKNADPAAYADATKTLKDMKKGLADMKKLWGTKLFSEFLSGYSRSAERWQKLFLHNPMMRGLGRLLVWQQSKQTFTLHADGQAYDAQGNAFTFTDQPILLAHPMEMGSDLTAAWQTHFMTAGLKQPFEQVWEPVVDASLVKPGRYDDCTIELYHLMNKDKHGITMDGQKKIILKDCSADLKCIEGHSDWVHNLFEVKNFKYKEYTRQVNHIVTLLDKGTIAGRIKKDDVTVAQWLDWFTLAQITVFIDLATESEAHNVTALLLDYKQQHFPGIDPMAEFTLDW